MRRKQFDSINVVPFIDIMLVLLVIVLTTASFIQTGVIKLDLPSSSAKIKEKEKKELKISVDKDGNIFFNKSKIVKKELEEILLAYEKSTSIHIYCDKEAKYDNFVYILDILKKNDFIHLGVVTKHE